MMAQTTLPAKNETRIIEIVESAERTFTAVAIIAAPVLALLPAAIITASHLQTYLKYDALAAWPIAAGVEALGIAIVTTRVMLARQNAPALERRMDWAFVGYLSIVSAVNMGLNIANGAAIGWTYALGGQTLAELVLGLMAVPVSQLIATRNEIAQSAQDEDRANAQKTADAAKARAEKIEDEDRANAQAANIRAEQSAERAQIRAAKVAQPSPQVAQPVTTAPEVVTTLPGRIDPVVLVAALVADPDATYPQLAKPFGVSSAAVGKYVTTHGGRTAIIQAALEAATK